MLKRITAALAAGAIVGSAMFATSASATDTSFYINPVSVSHQCADEDSVNCTWHADRQGNGHGLSFIVRQFPGPAHLVCRFYYGPNAGRYDNCSLDGVTGGSESDGPIDPNRANVPATMSHRCANHDEVNCVSEAPGKYVVRQTSDPQRHLCVLYYGQDEQRNDYCIINR